MSPATAENKPLLTLRPGASAVEAAMVHAENATRVPLVPDPPREGRGTSFDGARFEVLEHVRLAMEALGQVHASDAITHNLVRAKIGQAQARAGWQPAPAEED